MRRLAAAALLAAGVLLLPSRPAPPAQATGLTEAQCAVDAACLAQFDVLATAAGNAFARAVVRAIAAATTVPGSGGSTSYCDTYPGACAGGGNGYRNRPGSHGPNNAITDVPGVLLGHYTNPAGPTGTTVLYFPDGAIGGVEVRGSAPGSRESDALKVPTPQRVNAVMLGGGSAFGLAAADGVVQYLAQQGKGYAPPGGGPGVVPVVPGAIIFDLYRFGHSDLVYPDAAYGFKATQAAAGGPVAVGSVGAGAGAESGSVRGGFGTASEDLGNGILVGAVVSVNSVGETFDPGNGCAFYAGNLQLQNEFGALRPPPAGCVKATPIAGGAAAHEPVKNTTIGLVATNVPLDKGLAARLAQAGQDGMARAIRPAHTMLDGDTMFAISTAKLSGTATVPTPAPASSPSTGATGSGTGTGGATIPALPYSAAGPKGVPAIAAALVAGATLLLTLPALARVRGRRKRRS